MTMSFLAVLAFFFGVLGTWSARFIARWTGFYNLPNPIVAQHKRPVAYLGGVGLAFGALMSLVAHWFVTERMDALATSAPAVRATLVGAIAFLLFGIIDDARPFSPSRKLLGQFALAVLPASMGLVPPVTGIWLVDVALGVFYTLTLLNAFNFTDVCDGLVSGLAVVLFGFIAIQFPEVRAVGVALAAASAGVLVFNRPPATIFLGDAGSHLIGFLAAALSIGLAQAKESTEPLGTVAIAAAVPLFEAVFITVIRIRKKLPWWRGSPDHFALRLQAAGFSALETDLMAWGAAAALAVAASVFARGDTLLRLFEVVLLVTACLLVGAMLVRLERRLHRESARSM